MFTVTASTILPCTVTGSWPRPRWFDASMWGRPLDTCTLDVRFREKYQDALATVISDQERAGLDILTRQALKHIAPEQLIVSSDCGFGRQGCNREIAFFKRASPSPRAPTSSATSWACPRLPCAAPTRPSKPTSSPKRRLPPRTGSRRFL